jgi:hypothetical protein
MTDRTSLNRRNKRYGVAVEKRIAAVLGTERYLANTGGPIDLIPLDGMCIQVKGGATVVSAVMREAFAKARAGAAKHKGLAAVALEDRRGSPHKRYICFELEEWAAWNGYPKEKTE